MLTREQLLSGFTGPIRPVRPPLLYRAALVLACVAMILLFLSYVALIVLTAWFLWWYATSIILGSLRTGSGTTLRGPALVLPIVAGVVLLAFLVKPFFARRLRPPGQVELSPTDEPLVFDLVRELCAVVGAPEPTRIVVDTDVNASASFRRGFLSLFGNDLQLTIGLPLVAGLSLRGLTGGLAHELGHFAQASGLRASYLVRSINLWFARVIYERDAWDALLVSGGTGLWGLFYVARALVWLTRRILWLFMVAGHAISTLLLRQMEYDADQYAVRVAGTESFTVTSQALPVLSVAQQMAVASLAEAWSERTLGDDIVRIVMAEHARIPEPLRREILEGVLDGKGSVFDTHPPDRRRIERAEATDEPGIFTLEAPAVELFRDFPGLSRRATIELYRAIVGSEIEERHLVEADAFAHQRAVARAAQGALERYFGAAITANRPLYVTVDVEPPPDPEPLRRELAEARRSALHLLVETRPVVEAMDPAEERLLRIQRLEWLLHAGLSFQAREVGLRGSDPATVMGVRQRSAQELDHLRWQLVPLRDALGRRLSAALRLAQEPSIAERAKPPDLEPLLQVQSALRDAYPEVRALLDDHDALALLLASLEGNEGNQQLAGLVRAGAARWYQALAALGRRLSATPYPFEHVGGDVSLGEHLVGVLPPTGDLDGLCRCISGFAERYGVLYRGVFGRLVAVAEAVENATAEPGS